MAVDVKAEPNKAVPVTDPELKFHDVIEELVHKANFDESRRHKLIGAVRAHFKDDFESLPDEERAARRAHQDITSGGIPALFVGGITQAQLDNIIEKAVARALAERDTQQAKALPAKPVDSAPAATKLENATE